MQWNIRIKGEGVMPFIWAHGLMGSIALDDATGYFHKKDLPITKTIRYDARGHGFTEGTDDVEDYIWPNLANDMIAIVDRLGIKNFIAGGQSMGSATALYVACMVPQRVKALVLATPNTIWDTRKEQAAIYSKSADIIEKRGIDIFINLLRSRPFLPQWLIREKPLDIEKYISSMLIIGEKRLPKILRAASISDLPAKKEFKPPSVPTLILAWPQDQTHPMQSARELQAIFPNSKMVLAKNVKELTEWPRKIKDFIAEISL